MALTIHDLADLIGADIIVKRFPNQESRWIAMFDGWQVRENDSIVSGTYGSGNTPENALASYVDEIKGKRIETIRREDRQTFIVPKTLTYYS